MDEDILVAATNENTTLFNDSANGTDAKDSEMVSTEWVVFLSLLYSLTTLLSIVGNVLVVIVFARGRRSRTDLRPFLINLAVADLIMAVFCMPFTFGDTIYKSWLFSEPMCPIVLFIQTLSVSASVFINVAVGVDRFIVVAFPLYSKASQARSKQVIVATWILSISIASAVVPFAHTQRIRNTTRIKCSEIWPSVQVQRFYSVALFVIIYLLPLLVLSVAYSIVGFVLWKRTTPGNRDQMRDMLQLRSKIKVLKMLILVVLMFGICWLPLHVFIMVVNFNPEILRYKSADEEHFYLGMYLAIHWLAMSNSFANPFIYGFFNESFRADLITLVYTWFPCCVCLKNAVPVSSSARGTDYQTFIRHRSSARSTSSSSWSSKQSSLRSMASCGSITTSEGKGTPRDTCLRNNLLRKNSVLLDVISIQAKSSKNNGPRDDV
ncbi:prolactin-releasing peptide receptor-like [Mizuhopecten yessoensis]|uniref:prolactin-releasing peptide receptor-like n=1 Tax=Mizuhopecten yessoensis TaxID=6573 RepID=UPI000B457619|nr:prolactin-releasing peptide receptor-like [Mizuhopecten yessoensis]